MNNLALLTVRTASTRLPEKCFLPLGNSTVLKFVYDRAINAGLDSIVCTSTDMSDDKIENYCKENQMRFFRGPLENKLMRWFLCAKQYNADYFHTVDVDDPLFNPNQVLQSLDLAKSQSLEAVFPSEVSANGGASMGYSLETKAVGRVIEVLPEEDVNEMVDIALKKYLDLEKVKIFPSQSTEITNTRLTLDYPEDYWLISSLVRILGDSASRDELLTFFQTNPDFIKINWFRNDAWAEKQVRTRNLK